MALYIEREELKEEILPNQVIQLRTALVVERDGVEVGRTYHRTVYSPGDDLSEAPDEVQAIASALWTPTVVAAYAKSIEEEVEELPSE